jgi:hypothetical protein
MLIVEPSRAALKHINILKDNIAYTLKLKGVTCKSIGEDRPLLTLAIDGDEVDALYALADTPGVAYACIAEESSKEFGLLLNNSIDVIKGIMHKDETFKVEVIGYAKDNDYVPRDLEFALTASLLAELSSINVRPSAKYADRLLRIYIASNSAYICKLSKQGVNGSPLGSNGYALCSIYNGLSALSCLNIILNGFIPKILLIYDEDNPNSLRLDARLTAYIARYMAVDELSLSYTSIKSSIIGKGIAVDILNAYILDIFSNAINEKRIALPFTSMHEISIVEQVVNSIAKDRLVLLPLMFMHSIYDEQLSSYCSKDIDDIMQSIHDYKHDDIINYAKECAVNIRSIKVKVTHTLMHDIIDTIMMNK